ncbi:MAG TPA: GNAT family N-acetyltransferase [Tepidisphaeraceae bacterium]|jgi:ribosomal protein S18 acetylase RimI-like enzyme|nr:GNAT family N-acetyltransferase [Tepidisphaeraceae bacterium]
MSELSIFRVRRGQELIASDAIQELHGKDAPDPSALQEFLQDPTCFLIVAVDHQRVIGSLDGYALRKPHRKEKQFLLYALDVREEYRRKGIGTKLVQQFVQEARNAAAYEIWVLTNEQNQAAVKVYESNGFRRMNQDDAMMELQLT